MSYIDSSVGTTLPQPQRPAGHDETTETPEEEAAETPEQEKAEGQIIDNLISQIDEVNIATRYEDDPILDEIGQLVIDEYQIDELSRGDWKDKAEKALKFANQETEPKNYPWPGASNVIYPLITTAAMQFAARTYPAVIQSMNVVRGVVWGSDKGTPALDQNQQPQMNPQTQQPVWIEPPGAKRARADRIGGHMSYQLLQEMPEWEPQTDQLLHMLPIVGGAARKTYFDPSHGRNFSLVVSLLDLVWNFHAKSFEDVPRVTEILTYYPVEIEEMVRAGLFLEVPYGNPDAEGAQAQDKDAPQLFLEQHRTFDLDGDGYPEPYVVTVHKQSQKTVRIVARYEEEGIQFDVDDDGEEVVTRIEPIQYYTLFPFLPNPKGGSYPIGFGHLLRSINESINTSINQMFDAGHLQNAGGGFIGTSLSLASGPINFQVGKYMPVNNKGQSIREAVFPMPFQGPSTVLFQLVQFLLGAGKEVASIQDILTGDSTMANQPPTTILALIEQGMKLYTSIIKRVYRALKEEYSKLYALNRKLLKEPQRFKVGDEWLEVTPDDYRQGGGVEPIADPTMVTDMQKLGRAQILLQFNNDPLVNQIELRRRFLDATMIDRVEDLLITQPQPTEAQQLQIEKLQTEIARQRAAELKDQSQAYLNMAQARTVASEPEMQWIEHQLEIMRYQLEAANTIVKAADVENRAHAHHADTTVKARAHGVTAPAKQVATHVATNPPVNQPPLGSQRPGVSAMETPPSNQGVSPVSPGSGSSLPQGPNGPMGGPQSGAGG